MGFKSMNSYNDEKYGNFFRLQNDGDCADVIFLYRNTGDVMMADTHYIMSNQYSGYATCSGKGCPACGKGVRIQSKLFVPLFVLGTSDPNGMTDRIQFWDRTLRFQPQLLNDVFRGYPNPSEYVFRITRHGVARDINTTYDIRAIRPNTDPATSYDAICSRFGITFPDHFNLICKDVDIFEMGALMSDSGSQVGQSYGSNNSGVSYGAVPRGGMSTPPVPSGDGMIPGSNIPYTNAGNVPPLPNMSTPSVPLNAQVPDAAPDPNELPFGSSDNAANSVPAAQTSATSIPDPLETNEDIDTTNLQF